MFVFSIKVKMQNQQHITVIHIRSKFKSEIEGKKPNLLALILLHLSETLPRNPHKNSRKLVKLSCVSNADQIDTKKIDYSPKEKKLLIDTY